MFALVVSAAESCAALTTDSVYFIDKDDGGRAFLRLFEKVAHAGRSDTYKHFNKVRA